MNEQKSPDAKKPAPSKPESAERIKKKLIARQAKKKLKK
jgi:hypothetical protein